MTKGKLIILEGMVGCGKSTQLRLAIEELNSKGVKFEYGREPGGVEISEDIRKIVLNQKYKAKMRSLVELLLFEAARAQFYAEKVGPVLDSGINILTDRSCLSTEAFQGYGRNLDLDKIRQYNGDATLGYNHDIAFIFDVEDVEASVLRARKATLKEGTADKFEAEESDFHTKVRDGYREIAKNTKNAFLVPHYEHLEVPDRIKVISKYVSQKLEDLF